jgi:integrase
MNDLRSALCAYVKFRRGLGYKFREQGKQLQDFIRFMQKRNATSVTNKLAMEWATLPPNSVSSRKLRLSYVRGFARYLTSLDPRTEVPPTGVFPSPLRPKPYIYTDPEIKKLLKAALKLPPAEGLRRWTYHCLFGLLAVTGLRISEALALQRGDVDLDDGVLTIRHTKFGKSRFIPIHTTTCKVLRSYAARREGSLPALCSPYFFVSEKGNQLLHWKVRRVFWRLSRQTGLRGQNGDSAPRIHDMRHTFATKTLLKWYRRGKNAELLVPLLSTYLGHSQVRDTYWYFSASPLLMGQAVKRLEAHWRQQT